MQQKIFLPNPTDAAEALAQRLSFRFDNSKDGRLVNVNEVLEDPHGFRYISPFGQAMPEAD
jgi:hypothetical protein